MGGNFIAEMPHPPKEKYFTCGDTTPSQSEIFFSIRIQPNYKEADTMAIHIPPDMIPRMDWNAEDKQAAWAFYRERLEQYFMIAGTPKEARVTHILFYGGKEASE